jgi:AraC-like DNA-binding protein
LYERDTYADGMPDERGRHGRWRDFQRHRQLAAAPDLRDLVSHHWCADWDLAGRAPFRQLLPPSLHLHLTMVTGEPAVLRGVAQRASTRVLAGRGRAFGVAFRPGVFRSLLPGSAAALTGRAVPATVVLGFDPVADLDRDPEAIAAGLDDLLRRHRTAPHPASATAAELVEIIAVTPDLTRVDTLAERCGMSVRALQRLCAEHVGVGPKWMIRFHRLREVRQRLEDGTAPTWADLAAELGYTDQAHFSRDFTAMLGEPPATYALRYPPMP